jgi:hypothetical protein
VYERTLLLLNQEAFSTLADRNLLRPTGIHKKKVLARENKFAASLFIGGPWHDYRENGKVPHSIV